MRLKTCLLYKESCKCLYIVSETSKLNEYSSLYIVFLNLISSFICGHNESRPNYSSLLVANNAGSLDNFGPGTLPAVFALVIMYVVHSKATILDQSTRRSNGTKL